MISPSHIYLEALWNEYEKDRSCDNFSIWSHFFSSLCSNKTTSLFKEVLKAFSVSRYSSWVSLKKPVGSNTLVHLQRGESRLLPEWKKKCLQKEINHKSIWIPQLQEWHLVTMGSQIHAFLLPKLAQEHWNHLKVTSVLSFAEHIFSRLYIVTEQRNISVQLLSSAPTWIHQRF